LPIDHLEQVFPHHTSTSLQRLLLTVWDGEPDELYCAAEFFCLVPEADLPFTPADLPCAGRPRTWRGLPAGEKRGPSS
jgi:hypothetical protein